MTDLTLPTPTTKLPWLGLPIGVSDRNGNPIHIGDVLHFDPAEWGSGDCYFCVEFNAGKVHHPGGGASDLTEWCVIVRKWDAHGAKGDSRPSMYATQDLPAPKPEGPEVWPVVLARFAAPEHAALRAELEARRDLGIARYGQTVHRDDGRPLGVDAFQELADALVYLQRDRMREDASDHPGGDLALELDETIGRVRQSLIALHRVLFWDDIGRRTVRFGLTPMQRAKITAALERGAYWGAIAADIGWEVETLKRHYEMDEP